uniref:Uncharacterized protein n=1 Tax=Trichuris muris TaxID=70415 RepID=A0A5S6QLJ4_TRIMR
MWFNERSFLHNVTVHGEGAADAAEAAMDYLKELAKMVNERRMPVVTPCVVLEAVALPKHNTLSQLQVSNSRMQMYSRLMNGEVEQRLYGVQRDRQPTSCSSNSCP